MKPECHAIECVSKGLHAVLAIGIFLELVSGNRVFHGATLDSGWIQDAFAVILLLALAYPLVWWYGKRNALTSDPSSLTGVNQTRKFVQGIGLLAVSLLSLTGFLAFVLGLSGVSHGPWLLAEDLVWHQYLVVFVWVYLAGHLIMWLMRRSQTSPAYPNVSS